MQLLKRFSGLAGAAALVIGLAGVSHDAEAGLIDYSADIVWVLDSPPDSVEIDVLESGPRADAPYNDQFWVMYFEESTHQMFDFAIPVNATEPGKYYDRPDFAGLFGRRSEDYPEIEAGAWINSHLLHFDPAVDPIMIGYVTFDEPIIGVIAVDRQCELWDFADTHVGAPGTAYTDRCRKRGLEVGNNYDGFEISEDRRTLNFGIKQGGHGIDEIRILTSTPHPVPEPASIALFGLGALVVAGAIRRRRR